MDTPLTPAAFSELAYEIVQGMVRLESALIRKEVRLIDGERLACHMLRQTIENLNVLRALQRP